MTVIFFVLVTILVTLIFISICIKEEKSYKEIIHDIDQEIRSGMDVLDVQYNSKKDIEYKIELQKRYEL